MKNDRCIINELAQIIAEDKSLKAVRLDAVHKRLSYAFEDGFGNKESKQRLERVIAQFKPKKNTKCIEDVWQKIDCLLCEQGVTQPMPSNVKLVTIPGSGVMIQKSNVSGLHCTWRWHNSSWVHLRPRQFTIPSELTNLSEWKQRLLFAIICGIAVLLGFVFERSLIVLPQETALGFYLIAYLTGAFFPFRETLELLRKGVLDVHFLMICVALGAAFIGHWWEGAILLFLFSLSGALEEMAMANTEREIKSLFKAAPKTAVVVDEGGRESTVNIENLQVGMVLRVRPGEQFPVDSRIIQGTTAANESNLTGESLPVDKRQGDMVFSGTINLWGSVDCRILKLANESMLAKIINLIQQAQESKAPSQKFTDKFSTSYTYGILSLSILMFFIWWIVLHVPAFVAPAGEASAFYRAMTLLVVASPCALVLSIPSAILAGIAAGAKGGVLFRGGAAIENLAQINRVALDKTGTLTTGELKVIKVNSSPVAKEKELLKIAASLAHHSAHPVSKAIAKFYLEKEQGLLEVKNFQSLAGLGLQAEINGLKNKISIGRRSMFENKTWLQEFAEPEFGVTEVIIESDDVKGQILLLDQVRSASAPFLKDLQSKGIKVSMLTGDRLEAANLIARHVGITDIHAALHPEQKVAKIQQWQKEGDRVAMVGDGVNDAPSLAAAHVAVGMGLRGSDAVLEQADIVLMQDKLDNFIFAFNLSQKASRIIKQNLTISLGVIIVLVISALGSAIPLTVGVIGHEGSTVLVVLNSLRLLINNKK